LGLALAPAAMAAGHAGGGFGGHFGGFSGHVGDFGGHAGGFGGEHAPGIEPSFGSHPFDGGNLVAGRGFAGGGGHLGDGLALGGRGIGGSHLMYGRVARFGRGGVFLGYYDPDPSICYQYPGYYNPAVGCYGLYPAG
jgi:hypothetical protein